MPSQDTTTWQGSAPAELAKALNVPVDVTSVVLRGPASTAAAWSTIVFAHGRFWTIGPIANGCRVADVLDVARGSDVTDLRLRHAYACAIRQSEGRHVLSWFGDLGSHVPPSGGKVLLGGHVFTVVEAQQDAISGYVQVLGITAGDE